MESRTWEKILQARLSRRRGLALAGAAGAIVACGGSSSSSSSSAASSSGNSSSSSSSGGSTNSLLIKPKDTSSSAVKGGTWNKPRTGTIYHFDPTDTNNGANPLPVFAYSQPVKYKAGTIDGPPDGTLSGDAAQSWELSGDGLTLTFKLRPNVKLDPRPPTNGRVFDADDWVYSWKKFVATAPQAGELSAEKANGAPILSWSNPDKNTVVLKMAYPYAPLIGSLADARIALVLIPVESADKFDMHKETRGSGAFMLQNYVPDQRIEWVRNPNFWDAGKPYLDGITEFLISDYSQRVAQFRSGAIWNADIRAEDVIRTKTEVSKLDAWLTPLPLTAPRFVGFSWKENSPFRDIRIRQALSMLVDRKGLADLQYNTSAFAKQGINLTTKQHTLISAADSRYWVDPTTSAIGEGQKYLSFNPDEAAKLINAAGQKGLAFQYHVPAADVSDRLFQALNEMFNTGGLFKSTLDEVEVKQYKATFELYWHGTHDGLADFPGGSAADPDITMTRYQSNSPFKMFPGDGAAGQPGANAESIKNPVPFDDLLKKQRTEVDFQKRKDLWKQIQVEYAKNVTDIAAVPPLLANSVALGWPYFSNYSNVVAWSSNVFNNGTSLEAFIQYWHDKSKA